MNEKFILEKIGKGYVLGVSRNPNISSVLTPGFGRYGEGNLHVRDTLVIENVIKGLHKLTEKGEPPFIEREVGIGYRLGWREMGLSPEFEWYVHVQ